jgi:hypothetical protein
LAVSLRYTIIANNFCPLKWALVSSKDASLKILLSALLILIPFLGYAEDIVVNGTTYDIEEKTQTLNCNEFSIHTKERSFPFAIRESRIPYELTMKHLGRPHLISQSNSYISVDKSVPIPALESITFNYERIDAKRPYISEPVKCLDGKKVLFTMWGGGNCSTVCEAWAIVEFTKNGLVRSFQGIAYDEFKSLSTQN